METSPLLFAAIVGLAFLCEYVDSSLGMGYGTTLTPLLLLMGFRPLQVVPCVLFSEFITGLVAGGFHHLFGNIRLDFGPDEELLKRRLRGWGYIPKSLDSKMIFVFALCGVLGVMIAVSFAVSIPKTALNTYIGVMVLVIGVVILWRRNRDFTFSWKKVVGLGLLSAFNKGMSGGGYGPLVAGGQILTGRDTKSAIGITSFAEGLVSLVGVLVYLAARGNLHWALALPLVIGAVASTPLAAFTTKKIGTGQLKLVVGILVTVLGLVTLLKTYVIR